MVKWIRDANGGAKHEAPLKDAAGALPPGVMAKLHAKAGTRAADASTAKTGTTATRDAKHASAKKRFANKPQDAKISTAVR